MAATNPSSSLKTSGIAYVCKINTSGNNSAPSWTTIGSQSSSKFSFKNKVIDVTGLDDAGWDAAIPGQNSWTLTMDSWLILTDAGIVGAHTAYKNRTPVYIELSCPNGNAYYGNAVIATMDADLAFDKGAAISISFQGDQALDNFAI
jgi:predicted secreted protein